MDVLEKLRKKNPHLPLFSVLDPAFAPYGRVLPVLDPASLRAALAQTRIPEEGNSYTASDPVLEATPDVRHLADTVYGGLHPERGGVPQVLGGELLHHGPGAAAGPARGYP